MRQLDLNCDMGESFGIWRLGQDEQVMPHITSANVACGMHGGDPSVMIATVGLAKKWGVSVGAHPSYPDLQGFGRRPMKMTAEEIQGYVLYQIGALWAIAKASGVELVHVKPHGALYNVASKDRSVAEPIAKAVSGFSSDLKLYCLPESELEAAGREYGLTTFAEGFVDRAYEPNGSLVDRNMPGSVTSDASQAVKQALMLASGQILCRDGTSLKLAVDTLCVHGDTPGAPEIAREVNAALRLAGYAVAASTPRS
ncbi:MAG: 5-oxoprolinase subunit PxpA [Chloroflexia bacterium]